jgi:hypothetical protein
MSNDLFRSRVSGFREARIATDQGATSAHFFKVFAADETVAPCAVHSTGCGAASGSNTRRKPQIEEILDSAYVSALAALAGSSIGAFATFATTWLSQSYQNRIQRHLNERSRRETLFGEFINDAATAYTDSLVKNLENPALLVNLYAIKSKISLFADEEILNEADKVVQIILTRYHQKNVTYSEIDPQFDLLRAFTRSCREEMMKY